MNFKAVLALPKTARSAQTHKRISFIWIVWSTLCISLLWKSTFGDHVNASQITKRFSWFNFWAKIYIWLAVQPCALKVRSYSNIGLQKNTLEITFYIFVLISLSLFPGLVYICHGFTEHMANYNGLGEASLIFFHCIYSTCTIRSRGLYFCYPIFHCGLYCRAVSATDNLYTKQEKFSTSKIRGL